jgi:hypothetical protein
MSTRLDCPAAACWQLVLEQSLSADQRAPYEQHLEACPHCQDQIHRADVYATLVRDLGRRLGDPTVVPADPTLLQALQELHSRPAAQESADLSFLQPPARHDLLGMLGPYEVIEVIGQGGMGIVFKAFEPALQRLVAIKVLAPALAGSARARLRFTREAQAAAAIRHEHVVPIYGVSETEGLPYLVMQYIPGGSLQELLDRSGPLALDDVLRLGQQTASGLAAAHARGLIHRDIKPANLLLHGEPGVLTSGVVHAKLTDFGVARAVDDIGLTQSGVVAGTPAYMAPEQARDEPVDQRADLFSLGCVLYAACTGVAPFRGTTTLEVLRQVSEEMPVPLCTLRPEVPAWLEALIDRLLAKDPAERCQSAAEVASELERGGPPSDQAPRTRWPWLLALGGTFLAFLTGFVLLAQQAPEPAPPAGPVEFSHDFRGKALPAELKPLGNEQWLHFEPEGLRITLPADRADLNPVGVVSTFALKGDFELTTTFEILHAEVPQAGWGVGVKLYIEKGPPSREGANIARLARAKDQQILMWDRAIGPPDGSRRFEGRPSSCTAKQGRLRLKRTGAVLHYQWSPDTSGEAFEEVRQAEYGSDDIAIFTLSGTTGRQPCRLDVRLLDLCVRGVASAPAPLPPRRSTWKAWLALLLLILLAAAAGLAAWQSQRARARKARAPAKDATDKTRRS